MRDGIRPNYNTQFAFVNKEDSFYLNFLQKNTIKLDFYLSRHNEPVLLGRCEFMLRELVEAEGHLHEANNKTPVFERFGEIYPVVTSGRDKVGYRDTHLKPIGRIAFKLRLRKPISEAMRFYREQNELKNIERYVEINQGASVKPTKKLITISVVAAYDLVVKHSEIAQIAPFFYYRFYTFEDKQSYNGKGRMPVFNDT